ncbi:hypothetical protein K450DRAFT_233921 [Umbelopsis ramanniana AG]|uniref:Methyltransferase domain-containing protein n=1 Tax=Umbelopsis ramanniana AG TaxID=1314678 RepID=A0AAD5HEB7_UMBRA|nr:uncharacterized protein K450DRAFT_233921 [Umbelopsis ramanniana AG]KAI8581265.1 hypothetical protein K450DRAFT_233921 [Umbelopsis ramanniana AG]
MGNETSKAKVEALTDGKWQVKQWTLLNQQLSNSGDASSIKSNASSTHSGLFTNRTDTMSSGNSVESETRQKKKRKPFKYAKDLLFNGSISPWGQDKALYRTDQTSSTSSLQLRTLTEDTLEGLRTSNSITSVTASSMDHVSDEDDLTLVAEKGCHVGHEIMSNIFTLEAYQTLYHRLCLVQVEDRLRSGAQVLHLGCGSAEWSLAMAKIFPEVTFYAVDTAEYLSTAKLRHIPKNVCIQTARNGLDHLPFSDQSFDYVMCRFLTFRIFNWRSLVDEMVRLTKPGCYIELCEPDYLNIASYGPVTQLLANALMNMMLNNNIDPYIADELDNLLSETETLLFVNSQSAFISLVNQNVSQHLFSVTVHGLGRYITDWKPNDTTDLDSLVAQYVRECQEAEGHISVRSVFAQRSRLL